MTPSEHLHLLSRWVLAVAKTPVALRNDLFASMERALAEPAAEPSLSRRS